MIYYITDIVQYKMQENWHGKAFTVKPTLFLCPCFQRQ